MGYPEGTASATFPPDSRDAALFGSGKLCESRPNVKARQEQTTGGNYIAVGTNARRADRQACPSVLFLVFGVFLNRRSEHVV